MKELNSIFVYSFHEFKKLKSFHEFKHVYNKVTQVWTFGSNNGSFNFCIQLQGQKYKTKFVAVKSKIRDG